ncbi:MAG: hypothetical protein JHD02_06915 [Thermoleophilaceae bacterium]|nr:hypothetical protein [Thermoleophilaceae bacterium]
MAAITIRDLDDEVKERLRVQAAGNGRSMEAEARALIDAGTARPSRAKNIGVAFIELGKEFGGIELELPSRKEPDKRPVVFSDEWEQERAAYNAEMARKRAAKSKVDT